MVAVSLALKLAKPFLLLAQPTGVHIAQLTITPFPFRTQVRLSLVKVDVVEFVVELEVEVVADADVVLL